MTVEEVTSKRVIPSGKRWQHDSHLQRAEFTVKMLDKMKKVKERKLHACSVGARVD